MATKRTSTRRSNEGGSTLYGALAGLLIGLIIAAAVAFYVTKAPVPFVDRASRQTSQTPLPDPSTAPDPNRGLYGKDGPAGTASGGPTVTATAPLPGRDPAAPANPPPQTPAKLDALGALIATLPPSGASSSPPTARVPSTAAPAAGKSAPAPSVSAAAPPSATGSYFLQAGAYRATNDAESLKARILLLGLPAAVQRAEVNGMQVNRVRVGPFARLDDMNRARSRLGENEIESAVVRQ